MSVGGTKRKRKARVGKAGVWILDGKSRIESSIVDVFMLLVLFLTVAGGAEIKYYLGNLLG